MSAAPKKSQKPKDEPKSDQAPTTTRYYRLKKISRYQYQIVAVDVVNATEIPLEKEDLRQICMKKLDGLVDA